MKKTGKLLSLLLSVCLVAGLLPVNAMAEGTDVAAGRSIQIVNDGNAVNIKGGQGSSVYLGAYKQSSNGSGGYNNDPIKWRVLQNADSKLFLLSDQNLDVFQYHTEHESVTWETSTMRSWLNGLANNKGNEDNAIDYASDNFLGNAFSAKEQGVIADTYVYNNTQSDGTSNPNPNYSTPGGNNTKDKIFLLSVEEANNSNYFPNGNNSRIATNTAYVASGGKISSGMNLAGSADSWWLRSPGDGNGNAVGVSYAGGVFFSGPSVNNRYYTVRPAFNLNLESVLFTSAAEGGKSPDANGGGNQGGEAAGGLFETKPYNGTEWKLTLKDENRNSFSVLTTDVADKKLTLTYTGATAGSNEYVSAIIKDANGTITHYGRLKNVSNETMKDGTVEITLPDNFDSSNSKLYVFSEQYNGDKMTDYASELKEVSLSRNVYNITNNLTNLTSANGTNVVVDGANDYTGTFNATGVYRVPDEISVKVGSAELADTDYTYTPSSDKLSATLTISKEKITGDIEITVIAAVAKQDTPAAVFNATSDNRGSLTNVDNTMSYSLDGGANWTKITDELLTTEGVNVSGVTADKDVWVRKDGNNTANTSEIQKIDITQAQQPTELNTTDCTTTEQNSGQISGVDSTMEYKKSDDADWTQITGNTVIGLTNGTYDVRVKANGTVLASPAATVTIGAHTCVAQEGWHSDKDNHWNTCECGEKLNEAAHQFGDWTVTKEATKTEAGSRTKSCTVCGYEVMESIPATGTTEPTDPPKPTDPDKEKPGEGTDTPQTGDNSNLPLWIAILFVSGSALTAAALYSRKRRKAER